MTKPYLSLQSSISYLACLLLIFLIIQPTVTNAQKLAKSTDNCTQQVVGYVKGLVIFSCNRTSDGQQTCIIEKSQCECAAKKFKGAKGCVDGSGNVIKLATSNSKAKPETHETSLGFAAKGGGSDEGKEDSMVPQVHYLAGEKNCMIKSESGTYISRQIAEAMPNDVVLTAESNTQHSLFDFKAVDSDDPQKGFYILTTDEQPSALTADGEIVSLKDFKTLDTETKSKAQWNFFVNGKNADGISNYVLKPQHNPDNLVLAESPADNKLELTKQDTGSTDTKESEGETTQPETKSTNWIITRIF